MNQKFEAYYVVGTKSGRGVLYALESLGYNNSEQWSGEGRLGDTIYYTKPDMSIGMVDSDENYDLYKYIKDTATELKPMRWKAKECYPYYYVDSSLLVTETTEEGYTSDRMRYDVGNYFKTEEEAQAFADKLKELFKKERGIEDD
jgi:hypothetical protein